jgi:hypothetical protein
MDLGSIEEKWDQIDARGIENLLIMFFIQNYDIENTQIQKDTFQFHYEQTSH